MKVRFRDIANYEVQVKQVIRVISLMSEISVVKQRYRITEPKSLSHRVIYISG